MKTRYDVGQSVWYLDTIEDSAVCAAIKEMVIGANGVMCLIDNDIVVPESVCFESKESLVEHYLALLVQ